VAIPPVYRSRASFVANGSGGLKLPGGLAGAAGLSGIASQLGVSTGGDPSESPIFYDQLIRSRELLTRLVQSRFPDPRTGVATDSVPLVELLDIRARDPRRRTEIAIKKTDDAINTEIDIKTNLVRVAVDAEWPELSSAMANRIMSLVQDFNLEQRITRARGTRQFVQAQFAAAQGELAAAENRLRVFYEQNRQWRTSPALTFREGQLSRQVDGANDAYLSLRRELEKARIEEVNDTPVITVVDSAVGPRRAQWPQYALLFPTACLVGLTFGTLAAGVAALRADWAARHPEEAAELRRARHRVARDLRAPFAAKASRRGAPETEIL
jgi:uncharacterized protein involved in exopolysaccharide biosynthesis